MQLSDEGWGLNFLVKASPFSVFFDETTDVAFPTKDGGLWKKKKIVVSTTIYPEIKFAVIVTTAQYQDLVLLRYKGQSLINATYGIKKNPNDRFAPIIFSGATA